MKGSEERDLLFARLFGLNALVSSGCIVSCHEAQGRRTWLDTVQAIIELGDKKAWLRESAWFSLVRAVRALLDDEVKVEWKEEAVDALTAKVYRDVVETSNVKKGSATTTTTQRKGLPWTQEKVALTIVLQQLRPVSSTPLEILVR
jgi:DNA polymerase phi